MSPRILLFTAVLATLAGCSWLHPVTHDVAPPVEVPAAYVRGTETSSVAEGEWWRAFHDPALDELVDKVLAQNLDLHRAFARLAQAEAIAAGADSAWWPQINAEANVSRSRQVLRFGQQGLDFLQTQYNLSLAASYELDLWGRVASTTRAAAFDLAATRQDVEALAITLSAQVAETWFQLIEQRATQRLLDEQLTANRTYLELVELRFGQGLATALDVFQQRQQLAAQKALLPPVEARLAVLEHQLAVLLGRAPGSQLPAAPAALPEPPGLPESGVPVALLDRRPDVRAARMRVVSADYRVGAAIADRFPTRRLTASTGFRAFELSDLISNWLWNLAGSLVGPRFVGGRRAAEVERTRAVLQDQLAGYGQAMLVALREVEDALVQADRQEALVFELGEQLGLADATLAQARSRYLDGLSDYLPVLTALSAKQQLEVRLLAAQRQRLSFHVQLARALGGEWTRSLEPRAPLPPRPPSGASR